jgi:hypothetical protein
MYPTMTGHSYVKWDIRDRVSKGQIVLGGFEQSGHCFYVDAEGNTIEDPIVYNLAVLQYLEENSMTLKQAFDTLGPFAVGPSIKTYLNLTKKVGDQTDQERKYAIMRELAGKLQAMIGQTVISGKYKITAVKVWDRKKNDSIRIFIGDMNGNFVGSIVFRPSSNEQLSGENDDAAIDMSLGFEEGTRQARAIMKQMHLFITFLAAQYYPEFSAIFYNKEQKAGPNGEGDLVYTPEEALRFALDNGWEKLTSPSNIYKLRFAETGNNVEFAAAVSSPVTIENTGEEDTSAITSTVGGREFTPLVNVRNLRIEESKIDRHLEEAEEELAKLIQIKASVDRIATQRTIVSQLANVLSEIEAAERRASSPVQPPDTLGGIDLRSIPMMIQPMGGFSGLQFNLLGSNYLNSVNLDRELKEIKAMVAGGIIPSGERLKEYVAACYQKKAARDKLNSLIPELVKVCKLQEEIGMEADQSLRQVLVLVDTI